MEIWKRAWWKEAVKQKCRGSQLLTDASLPSLLLNQLGCLKDEFPVILRGIHCISFKEWECVTHWSEPRFISWTYHGLGGPRPQSCTGSCWWLQTARTHREDLVCNVGLAATSSCSSKESSSFTHSKHSPGQGRVASPVQQQQDRPLQATFVNSKSVWTVKDISQPLQGSRINSGACNTKHYFASTFHLSEQQECSSITCM